MNRLSRGGKPTSPCIVPARAQSFNCGPTGRWGGHRSTGDSKLSHCCMFLNHTSVLRHIPATKPWHTWASGRSKWRPGLAGDSDVMAAGRRPGAAGPAQDVRHQLAGDVQVKTQLTDLCHVECYVCIHTRGLVV